MRIKISLKIRDITNRFVRRNRTVLNMCGFFLPFHRSPVGKDMKALRINFVVTECLSVFVAFGLLQVSVGVR
jgi:hypothetical protein